MTWRKFLRDRYATLVVLLLALALLSLVVRLDLWQQDGDVSQATWLYGGLLVAVLLVAALLLDWQRQRNYFQELSRLQADTELAGAALVQSAVTGEQRCVQSLLQQLYHRWQGQLSSYRQQQELQTVFQNRWVHQMKTPLSVIDLLLQQAERGEIAPTELCSSLREERDKLAAGLEMMLHNARLGQFSLDFVIAPVDLVELSRQVINEQKGLFIRAGVYPKLQGVERATVETDGKWLAVALSQIVANAIKYSRPEQPASRVVTLEILPTGHGYRLTVADQGVGIPPEDLGLIWQAFYTGQNGRRYPQATGMGLFLTKTICQRLGHPLAVESTVGRGSTFSIEFRTDGSLQHGLVTVPDGAGAKIQPS